MPALDVFSSKPPTEMTPELAHAINVVVGSSTQGLLLASSESVLRWGHIMQAAQNEPLQRFALSKDDVLLIRRALLMRIASAFRVSGESFATSESLNVYLWKPASVYNCYSREAKELNLDWFMENEMKRFVEAETRAEVLAAAGVTSEHVRHVLALNVFKLRSVVGRYKRELRVYIEACQTLR